MTAPEERERPKPPKVSRLAIAALIMEGLVLGLVLLRPYYVGGLDLVLGKYFVPLGGLLAVLALLPSIVGRDWRSAVISVVALLICLFLVGLCYLFLRGGVRFGNAFYPLQPIQDATRVYYEREGTVPQSIDDLVQAGLLVQYGRSFLSPFILAPLDDRFMFDRDLNDAVGLSLICAYCTADDPKGSGKWWYIGLSIRPQSEAAAEVLQKVAVQKEAITWLDDSFSLAELKQIAEGDEGRRARMASAILKYRQTKAGQEEREIQGLAPEG